jgi:uncharacterized protein YndB with AHSA1/START domain
MEGSSITHSTFAIEREYAAKPERVFAALADPAQKRRWFAEEGKGAGVEFTMDFRVGGSEVSTFRGGKGTPVAGVLFTNHTTYLDIVENERVVLAYTMAMAGRRFSASLATFALTPTPTGTRLTFTEQGAFFAGADGPALREQGWNALLGQLARMLAE